MRRRARMDQAAPGEAAAPEVSSIRPRSLLGVAWGKSYLAATRQLEPTFNGRLKRPSVGRFGSRETAEPSRRRESTSVHPQERHAHS